MSKRIVTIRGGVGARDVTFEGDYWWTVDYDDRAGLAKRILRDWSHITGLNWEAIAVEDHSDMKGNEEHFMFTTVSAPLHNQTRITFFIPREKDGDATK